ncbi:MAG: DUF427 domain-containing protein [Rhodospirillaceae bacterium]|jgi:uncharacterized protein (DUF427 family)|nr:DUF427 domain-containing protein [Rhodospirillaceae bacterium]
MVEGAIQNPGNPDHFMVAQPVGRRVQLYIGETLIADTMAALRVIEVGKSVYAPCLYIPHADVTVDMVKTEKITHCPLKGDAAYYTIGDKEMAWGYETFDFAKVLEGHVSFWTQELRIVEGDG